VLETFSIGWAFAIVVKIDQLNKVVVYSLSVIVCRRLARAEIFVNVVTRKKR
jgi:hypothetical protein